MQLYNPDQQFPRRVGLLAGAGRFPIIFAEAARRQGLYVHCLGVDGMASEKLADCCDVCEFVPLALLAASSRLAHVAHVVPLRDAEQKGRHPAARGDSRV
ncbi:MAG: hypothetical protein NT069_27430 [Planctomycetota bacterium]|nr:hypothetical protein [Planctomycetota bacterium]